MENKKKKIFNKKTAVIILLIALFSGLFLVNVPKANAQLGFLEDIGKGILRAIFAFLLWAAQLFTGLAGKIFDKVLNFGFDQSLMGRNGPIYIAWTITRDIVNMFFILGLVVIAFATILRIETYGMKTLLPKLIIVALFINFSFLACGIIIDAANVVTDYFRGQIIDAAKSTPEEPVPVTDISIVILDNLGVQKALTQESGQSVAIAYSDPEMRAILNTAFSAAIIFVAGFVLLIGAVLLFLRVGALWTLTILVPFAWFFGIFPALASHYKKWWDEFFKWAFFAPVYVFFIYIILTIAQEVKKTATDLSPDPLQAMALSEMMSNWSLLFVYVFLVILLFSAPTIAMSMGIKAANAVTTTAKGALRGTAKLPLKVHKAVHKAATTMIPPAWMEKKVPILAKVVRGIQRTAAFTSLELWKKAFEARKAERQRKARLGYIVGKQQDILNRVFSLFSEKTNFAEQAEQFEVAERKTEVEAETKRVGSKLIAKLKEALKQKDVLTYKAVVELLQEQGDTNDAMIFSDMYDDMKFDDKYALEKNKGQNINDSGVDENGESKRRFGNLQFKHGTIQQMRQMGLSDQQIAPFLGKIQEIALGAGYYGLYGMAKTDDKGNWLIGSDEYQAETAANKIKTQIVRQRKLHGTAIGLQGANKKGEYKFMGNEDAADKIMETYTLADADATQMQYTRADAQTSLSQAYEKGALNKLGAGAIRLGKKVDDALKGKGGEKKEGKEEEKKEEGKKLSKKEAWKEIKKEAKNLEK